MTAAICNLLVQLTGALVEQAKGSYHYIDIPQSGAFLEQGEGLSS